MTNGLLGLTLCESPQDRPKILHRTILDVFVQTPENVAYRKYTKQITNEKLGTVKTEPEVIKLEEQLQSG